MPGRGPKRLPSAVLALRGSTLTTERRREEIAGPAGEPVMPVELDEIARLAWADLVPILRDMGVLSRADGRTLARYCTAWSRWCAAKRLVEADGLLEIGTSRTRVSPAVDVLERAGKELTQLECEFGLTPSARTRLKTSPVIHDDNIARYLRPPG